MSVTTLSSLPTKIVTDPVVITENEEYSNAKAKWALLDACYNVELKTYAHRFLTPPPGLFQEELVQNAALTNAMLGLITPVAVGSGWPAAAIIYANGGFEPQLLGKTTTGFMSLVSEHDPVVELPVLLEYLKESCTKDNKTIIEFFLAIVLEVLVKGRVPILIDFDEEVKKLKFVAYKTEALIDWGTTNIGTNDTKFNYAIFRDYELNSAFNPVKSNKNTKYIEVIYYHYLNEENIYTVTQYKKVNGVYKETNTVIPEHFGKQLDYIPLITIGSLDNTPNIDSIPLEGIANCILEIYGLSCMLKHAEKTSAVPTLYMTGTDKEEAPSAMGANVCVVLADSQAKVGYTTTDTSAMSHIQDRMTDYYAQAQELGASLLGARRGTSESGEALRLRQAAATASLKSIVDNVGKGLAILFQMIADWSTSAVSEVRFDPNREFSTYALTANETIALVQAWQATSISHSTLLENFRKAGMLKAGETVEDELETLKIPGEEFEALEEGAPNTGPGGVQLDVGEEMPKSNTMNKNIQNG